MAFLLFLFAAAIQLILFAGHWFVYKTTKRFFPGLSPFSLRFFKYFLAVMSASFLLSNLVAFLFHNLASRLLYIVSAAWLGTLWLVALAGLLCWTGWLLGRLAPALPKFQRAPAMLYALALLAAFYGMANASTLRVTDIAVNIPGLPSSWQGKKAVWISDAHLGQVYSYGFAEKLSEEINKLRPDIVFIGGDYFDGTAINTEKAAGPLSKISAPMEVYFVSGNHEQYGNSEKYAKALSGAGVTILDNRSLDIGGLQIIGVSYKDSKDASQMAELLEKLDIDPGRPSILLKHEPGNTAVSRKAGISLQISGHTHGGAQIAFPFKALTELLYPGFVYGLNSNGSTLVYTSSGAGTWGPPLRIGTISEIAAITFQKPAEAGPALE